VKIATRIGLCLLVVVPAVVMAWWWIQFRTGDVETHTVEPADLMAGVTVSGTIRTTQKTAVAAEIVAPVRRLAVTEGQLVGPGDVLVELDDSVIAAECAKARARVEVAKQYLAELKAGPRKEEIAKARESLKQAEARCTHASKDHTNISDLAARGGATQSELDKVQSRLKVAQAELAWAKANLELLLAGARAERIARAEAEVRLAEAGLRRCLAEQAKFTLRAPHAGVVTVRYVHVGEVTSPGQVLMRLDNIQALEIRAQVQESQLRGIRPGDTAEVLADAYPDHAIQATVKRILPRIDPESGTVVVLLTLAGKQPVTLMDGMAVDIALIRERREGVLLVPVESVTGSGDEATVLVRDGGSFERRSVAAGISDGHWVEIKSGLTAGDVVRVR